MKDIQPLQFLKNSSNYLGKKILSGLFSFYFLLPQKNVSFGKDSVESILIILRKNIGMGDMIMLSPFIVFCHTYFKNAKITIFSEYPNIFEIDFAANWVKDTKELEKTYDFVFAPTLSYKNLALFNKGTYKMGYFFSRRLYSNFAVSHVVAKEKGEHYLLRAIEMIKQIKQSFQQESAEDHSYLKIKGDEIDTKYKKSIVISPFSNSIERSLTAIDIKNILLTLQEVKKNKEVFFIGIDTKENVKIIKKVLSQKYKVKITSLLGKTSFREMVSIIKNADLFVGVDSAPLHIASISDVPSIGIYFAYYPKWRLPMVEHKVSSLLYRDIGKINTLL